MPFELKAKIGLDNSGLIYGLEQGKAAVKSFGTSAGNILQQELGSIKNQLLAAFGTGAIIAAATETVRYAGHIQDVSEKTGVATKMVQALEYATRQSGASVEDVAGSFKHLAIARQKALEGDKESRGFFKELGFDFAALQAYNPEALFFQIAEKIRAAGGATEHMGAMVALLGKNADSLVPAMKEDIGGLAVEFDKLGLAIDDRVIKKLDELGDRWDRVKFKMRKNFAQGGIADSLVDMLDIFSGGNVVDNAWSKIKDLFARGRNEVFGTIFQSIGQDIANAAKPAIEIMSKADRFRGVEMKNIEITKATKSEQKEEAARQFDSLARIGGFAQNTDRQIQIQIGKQILTELQIMRKKVTEGGLGDESIFPPSL